MSQSSNLLSRKKISSKTCSQPYYSQVTTWVSVACACMLYSQNAIAAGGCGSISLPLEALDLDSALVSNNAFRVALITERAEFDNFREGSRSLTNPGGNTAVITQTTLQLDYGYSEKLTVSLLLPYVKKDQQTKKFGKRIAEGVSDISIFGRYELSSALAQSQGEATSIGLGLKFPNGSIDEPDTANLLPPAFQVGSGAYDLIPTASFNRVLGKGSVFGGIVWRIPLEKNKRGYKFGQELELNIGVDYPSPFFTDKLSFQLSSSYLAAEQDDDSAMMLPAKLRNNTTVLNTGGNFLDITPGFRWKFSKALTLQTRFSIPVYENWNGNRAANVGQVAPDLTVQVALIYTSSY